MSAAEWVAVCNRVIDLCGNMEVWATAKRAAYPQAKRYTQTLLLQIVDDAFAAGTRFAPSPSEMLRAAREQHRYLALPASADGVEEVRRKLVDGWHSFRPGPSGCAECGVAVGDHVVDTP